MGDPAPPHLVYIQLSGGTIRSAQKSVILYADLKITYKLLSSRNTTNITYIVK